MSKSQTKTNVFKKLIAGVIAILCFLQLSVFAEDFLGVWFDDFMLNYFSELFLDSSNSGIVKIVDNVFWFTTLASLIFISYRVYGWVLRLISKG